MSFFYQQSNIITNILSIVKKFIYKQYCNSNEQKF